MDNNGNGSGVAREMVTLILKERRFEVEKRKLIDKSQYFAALLSANYLEHDQTQHVINYDISPTLLQDFLDWIHNGKSAFTSVTNLYNTEELDHLLMLLELSVLFAVDNLEEDITDTIERHFMTPKYAINILSLAQELNINVLRDLSLAVCLDRFNDLPLNSIFEMSRENFLKLIGNINIRSTRSYVINIIHMWNIQHDFTLEIPYLDILNKKEKKILHGIITCEHNNREQFIHCLDGNDLFELTSFEYPTDIIEHYYSTGKKLEGVQFAARRYDLYLCGGEYGIGSGKFNKNIWRYSLISKKWCLETVMPVERRHMITVFVNNKLVLVGGVGQYRQKLQTIDIYDIHTGIWKTSDIKMPVQFTSVPEYFTLNDKLIICQYVPTIYVYFPERDVWETNFCKIIPKEFFSLPILTIDPMSCYIDIVDRDEMVLKIITRTCNVKNCNDIIRIVTHLFHIGKKKNIDIERGLHYIMNSKQNRFNLTPVFRKNTSDQVALIYTDCKIIEDSNFNTLHWHSIPIQDPRKFRSLAFTKKSSSRRLFNLRFFHPAYLHTINLNHI